MEKPGFWKTGLSYFFEFPVEKRQSGLSGEVVITFHRGAYKLCTQNAIYSFGNNYTSLSVPFRALDMNKQQIPSVLLLGVGLGSAADLLKRNDSIQQMIAVDADPLMIELAQRYLSDDLKKRIQFIEQDAAEFIRNNTRKFDLLVFDIFVDDDTPVQFRQQEFLEQLKQALNPEGWLLYSKLDNSFSGAEENKLFEKRMTLIFPEAFSIRANGNKVFCARKY